jgi:TonB family protein
MGLARMFILLNRVLQGRARGFAASIALHALLLACLLYRPAPRVLSPSFLMAGEHGSSVTRLYLPRRSTAAAAPRPARQVNHARLTLRQRQKAPPPSVVDVPKVNESTEEDTQAAAASPPPVGTPNGTSPFGSSSGDDVRPALPMATSDPVVSQEDLRGGIEGNEIVEITIDEKGNVVERVVLQSLGPSVDAKVLAALENWHFHPATRNGVPIPSKQDVYYHFPRKG